MQSEGKLVDGNFSIWNIRRPDGNIDQLSVSTRAHVGRYIINYTIPEVQGDYNILVMASYLGSTSIDVASFRALSPLQPIPEFAPTAIGPVGLILAIALIAVVFYIRRSRHASRDPRPQLTL